MSELLAAALVTYRKDRSALATPVWFREHGAAVAGRYLGADEGRRFAESRRSKPGVLLRLRGDRREWDLSGMLSR